MEDTLEHTNGHAPVVTAHKLGDTTEVMIAVERSTANLAQSIAGMLGLDRLDTVVSIALAEYRDALLRPPAPAPSPATNLRGRQPRGGK